MKRGFSTIELLIAFAIMLLVLPPLLLLAFGGQTGTLDVTLGNGGVTRVATQIRDAVASTTASWNSTPLPWATSFYTQNNKVINITPCVKQITATTSWSTEKSRAQSAVSTTYVPSIAEAQALGGGCDPFPPADAWDSPKKYPNGVTLSSVNTNDIAIISNNGKRIAVLIATPQGGGNDAAEDIYTYDLTDAQNPALLSKLNTGKGLNAVAVAGNYAYAVQNDATKQLQTIRLFDTAYSPSNALYYALATTSEVTLQNVSGANPEGRSIAYYNNKLYVGTWNNNVPANSPEFLVYDASAPSTPTLLGTYNLSHSVNSIAVKDSFAYLATTNNAGELMVMNVATPGTPTLAGQYDAPGSTLDAEEVYVLGNIAYLGFERATGSNYDFYTLNITTPSSPSLLGRIKLNMSNNSKVAGIAVAGSYAFVGTTDTNAEFRVFDVSNPAAPTSIGGCGPYNYSAKISEVVYANGYVYIANQANDALRVVYDTPGLTCN
jgi:hypothetical protein